ncbi:uncharacterized protein LOC116620183 [Nematostella vectensis]|uniref:uncharacterized protein LOC116620183 n=1 Tax=Nematostella vectensis TaxID=45351 RepID=UPI00139038AE|nr:uncharacterized protein LOC116620183 [Nematostella vectensis]
MAGLLFTALSFLVLVNSSQGFFKYTNCVQPSNSTTKTLKTHGCEDKDDVILSCPRGYNLAILSVFFGHGHGYKSTCDNSWFGQNCLASRSPSLARVKHLCQGKQSCVISPTQKVLGSTSCTFGLESDLFVDYVCNKEHINDVISIGNIALAPSPLILPGPLNVSASVTIKRHLPSTTKLKLNIQKKVLTWVKIPCVANFGSCTYDNFCELVRGVMFGKCDKEMENTGIPCDCPIPTGTFTLPPQAITVTPEMIEKVPVWDWLASGEYWVEARFMNAYDDLLGCITLQINVDINTKKKKRTIRIHHQ